MAHEDYEAALTKGACGFGIYFTTAADGAAVVDPTTPFYRLPDGALAPGEASGVIAPGDRLRAINATSVEGWRFADVVDELRRTPLGTATLRFDRREPPPPRERGDASDAAEATADDDDGDEAPPPLEPVEDASYADAESNTATPKRVRWKLFDWPASASADGEGVRTHAIDNTNSSSSTGAAAAMTRSAALEELLVDMEGRLRELEDAVEREKKCRFLAEKKNILYRNALSALSDENAQLRHALAAETREREAARRFQRCELELRI